MSLINDIFDGVKDMFEDASKFSKQTDIDCPKCHQSKLIQTDNSIGLADTICPNCGYSLNETLINNGGTPPCPPFSD